MAVSSYGSGTTTSGAVQILKDLSADIAGRDVVIVEDILEVYFESVNASEAYTYENQVG